MIRVRFLALSTLVLASAVSIRGENWPQWRGPGGQGVSSETKLPTTWAPGKNIALEDRVARNRTLVAGRLGRPRVRDCGDRGRSGARPASRRRTRKGASRSCILTAWRPTRSTPSRSWRSTQDRQDSVGQDGLRRHRLRRASSPQQLCRTDARDRRHDGLRVLRAGRAVCVRLRGQREVEGRGEVSDARSRLRGPRRSSTRISSSFSATKTTATTRSSWPTTRRRGRKSGERSVIRQISWGTPVIVQAGGRAELVTNGTESIIAYDPATGKELWRTDGVASNAIHTPLVGKGLVIVTAGYPAKKVIAIRPGTRARSASPGSIRRAPATSSRTFSTATTSTSSPTTAS